MPSHPQIVLNVVNRLHCAGYGLLKLACYTREGTGAWRYILFASPTFPDEATLALSGIPEPKVCGSHPDWDEIKHKDADEAAREFAVKNPLLMEAAIGSDENYTEWFAEIAAQANGARFQMERADQARLGNLRIYTPYELGWNRFGW
jgi:hypothetical protein